MDRKWWGAVQVLVVIVIYIFFVIMRLEFLPPENVIFTENIILHNLYIDGHGCGDRASLMRSVPHSHRTSNLLQLRIS